MDAVTGKDRTYDAFVSAVTSECGTIRNLVAAELRKQGLSVSVQSDFEHRPASVSVLRKLHDYIAHCAEIHCIIGGRGGGFPPPDVAAEFPGVLPDGMAEASYTQWEYFFAMKYAPAQTWLYVALDAYEPDLAAPTGPDRPDVQAAFRAYLARLDPDRIEFVHSGDVRAAVLANRKDRIPARMALNHQHPHEPLHRDILSNAIGGTIAALLGAALLWVISHIGVDANPMLMAPVVVAIVGGAIAALVIYLRYAAILARDGPDTREDYDLLRHHLVAGGFSTETYVRRLTAALEAVDRFFGDAGMADRTLFPRAFGLTKPAPLWTAPAYDRCLLLALVYPIATVFVLWAVSGHVGPAEHALFLKPDEPVWRRALTVVTIPLIGYRYCRFKKASGWRANLLWLGAVAGAFAGAVAGAGAVVAGVEYLNGRAIRGQWQGRFQVALTGLLIAGCLTAAATVAGTPTWPIFGAFLLFLGLLTLLNAPFDWLSLGLTRALLRRGLELGGLWPYVLALADAVLAAAVITVLGTVCVLGVQTFATVAVATGGEDAGILDVEDLLAGIHDRPADPEFWWVYAMLFSTMIPSLVNLAIGGASLFRGIPWLTAALLRRMPADRPPKAHDRTWMALVLAAQLFLGGLLGIATQGVLAWVVIGWFLPLFGFRLLDWAQMLAAADLPRHALAWAGVIRP